MMTICGCSGAAQRWEEQCAQPNIDAWRVPMAFSPYAPWGRQELYWSYLSGEDAIYIGASSELIFQRFDQTLRAQNVVASCSPDADELLYLFDVTQKRTPAQVQAILSELRFDHILLSLTALVDPTPKPSLLDLISWLVADAYRPLCFAKARYNRVRCYQLIPELAPDFLPDGTFPMHPSFPSGHSTQAHLIVNGLVSVFNRDKPVEQNARDAAWQIGKNREIAGLHYPSDTQGGRYMADVLIAEAESNAVYRAARDAVRAEYGLRP